MYPVIVLDPLPLESDPELFEPGFNPGWGGPLVRPSKLLIEPLRESSQTLLI